MRFIRTPLISEVVKYEINKDMEDGFELWSHIITNNGINAEKLIKITREDGTIVCPYICHRRGRTYIQENDYIIKDEDGTICVCGADKILNRYKKLD